MESYILETKNLTKKYRYALALDHVNLRLERGHIYGFIGNNGAGKTTLMRIVMGLAFADSGTFSLFGKSGRGELEQQRRRIGALIERPIGYETMTGRQNLAEEAILCPPGARKQIEGLMKRLRISQKDIGKPKLRAYSVGMRQRYGLASALLGEPELLILDEPTSGLDPNGVRELRHFFQQLHREKEITILMSSHILSELYQVATDYIFIDHGKIIRELTHDALKQEIKTRGEDLEEYFLSLVDSQEGAR